MYVYIYIYIYTCINLFVLMITLMRAIHISIIKTIVTLLILTVTMITIHLIMIVTSLAAEIVVMETQKWRVRGSRIVWRHPIRAAPEAEGAARPQRRRVIF